MNKKPYSARYIFNFSEIKKKLRELINNHKADKGKDKKRTPVSLHLMATAEKILELFIYKRDVSKPLNTPFNTWISALATLRTCCSRTMQRHLDELLEMGVFTSKFRRNHGIALQINTKLLVYTAAPAAAGAKPKQSPVQTEIVPPTAAKPRNLNDLQELFLSKFSIKNAMGT